MVERHIELFRELTDDEKYECVWWLDDSKWELFNYAHDVEMTDDKDIEFMEMVEVAKTGWDDLSENVKNFFRQKTIDNQSGH